MTTTYFGAPGVDERTNLNPLAAIRRAWSDWRDHRRTLGDLRALSIRQRDDLGIAGLDLDGVARAARNRHE